MAGEHEDKGTSPPGPEALQTIRAEALPGAAPGVDDPEALVEMHRREAARLLKEGAAGRAFGELVRASRAVPMTRRLAACLVLVARRAGNEPAAATLLTSGVQENEGNVRVEIRRQLARLLRKTGDLERAREELVLILAEKPGDRRARRTLNALLEREQRWEELDASLEKESREALKRGALSRAARASLARGRLWGEKLNNHAHAAVRYGQAADLLEQARDFEGAFTLRLLWVRSLREARSPGGALQDAVQRCIAAGDRVGKELRARALLREMGLLPGVPSPVPAPVPAQAEGEGRPVGRRNTQRELLAAAQEADAQGKKPEAAALYSAAVAEAPEPETLEKLEAHYVARGAWRELAHFYRDRADKAPMAVEKAELLTRMAELLEDELGDPAAAARAYGEIVELTGDERALREQVRLLSARQDFTGVQRALDLAVQAAVTDEAKTAALVARGEAALARRELGKARRDFEQALQRSPTSLGALAGLAESTAERGVDGPAQALKGALSVIPRRTPQRAEYLRRLARLADGALKDLELARWAWGELLGELPEDAAAHRRLVAIARKLGDWAKLDELLHAQLEREPRGPPAREAWRERVVVLEKTGRGEEAVEVLRQAVRAEPGHKEAWILLADRLAARGRNGEAAWAYEHAATATESEAERQQAWAKLARFAREVLKDPARANVFAARAENLRQAMEESAVAAQQAQPQDERPVVTPRIPEALLSAAMDKDEDADAADGPYTEVITDPGGRPDEAPEAPTDELIPVQVERERVGARQTQELQASEIVTGEARVDTVEVEEAWGGALEADEAEEAEEPRRRLGDASDRSSTDKMDRRRTTDEVPVADDDEDPEPTWAGGYATQAQEQLFEQVHADPLEPEGYRALADYFEDLGDAERSGLMAEISAALEGDPAAAPRAPKLLLSVADRSSLRHPFLRGQEGELLSAVGVALCRVFEPESNPDNEEFTLESGRGAPAAAEALQAAVRILGLRAPEVFVSSESGPPFSLDFVRTPRLLVGRAAVERVLPEAELRFFAGRALFAQNPDLLALRQLTLEQLEEALGLLELALWDGRAPSHEVRQLRELMPRKDVGALRRLFEQVRENMDLEILAEGARHSANRAGLVVCGGVAPALQALRAKRAPEEELMELVRFAASERYLKLRQRKLG